MDISVDKHEIFLLVFEQEASNGQITCAVNQGLILSSVQNNLNTILGTGTLKPDEGFSVAFKTEAAVAWSR
jgi:hypothetical protein